MTTSRDAQLLDDLKYDPIKARDEIINSTRKLRIELLSKARASYVYRYFGAKAASKYYGFSETDLTGSTSSPKSNKTFLLHRIEELKSVDTSLNAQLFGVDYAREQTGFTHQELILIKDLQIQEKEIALKDEQKKMIALREEQERKRQIRHIRERARELAKVDASWNASCFCRGQDYARAKAGFSDEEIYIIEKQIKHDRIHGLSDPDYLRERARELTEISNSWHFFGRNHALKKAGFSETEISAIEKQLDLDDKALKAKYQKTLLNFFKDPVIQNPETKNARRQNLIKMKDKYSL